MLVAMSSPSPAAVSLSATMNTTTTTAATIHRTSYCPRSTEVKLPANHTPRFCSMSVCSARKVETEPTTAPSMMPTMGTISDERRDTRRRKRKKTIVPMKAAMIAPIIRSRRLAPGKRIITASRPRPAHSVVPVVVGSTNRFCVSSCMTRPDIAIAAPARTSATVRGMRVMANISPPRSPPRS